MRRGTSSLSTKEYCLLFKNFTAQCVENAEILQYMGRKFLCDLSALCGEITIFNIRNVTSCFSTPLRRHFDVPDLFVLRVEKHSDRDIP